MDVVVLVGNGPVPVLCANNLERSGHRVVRIDVSGGPTSKPAGTAVNMLRRIGAVPGFSPGLILAINQYPFWIPAFALLERIVGAPVAVWHVDTPLDLLAGSTDSTCRDNVFHYFSDRDIIDVVQTRVLSRCHYLPLAWDENFLPAEAQTGRARANVVFLGSTYREYLESGPFRAVADSFAAIRATLRTAVAHSRDVPVSTFFETALLACGLQPKAQSGDVDAVVRSEYLRFLVSSEYRMALGRELSRCGLVVYGDEPWRDVLRPPAVYRPRTDYFRETPSIYCDAAVILNHTSYQLRSGVNARVFDVPACGGFLITDRRKELGNLFTLGSEIIAYDTREELAELIGVYRNRPRLRAEISARARERIRREHTYTHRMQEMLTVVKAGKDKTLETTRRAT